MNGWAIAWIAINTAGLAISATNHGKSKGNYNFGYALIACGIEVGLLYMAGTFG